MTLTPVRAGFDGAGVPFSSEYGDVYHSAAGAAGQARHVFLGGNGLPERWLAAPASDAATASTPDAGSTTGSVAAATPGGKPLPGHFTILETGFGLGVNFLATWAAWKKTKAEAAATGAAMVPRLHYVSIEKHPLRRDDLARVFAACTPEEWEPLVQALLAAWPVLTPGLHRIALHDGGEPGPVLTLALGDAEDLLPRLHAGVDAFYLDGFSPAKNPQMWSHAVLKPLARLAREGATLATYTVAASVRAALAEAGFTVSKHPGYGGKRDMLAGVFAPQWKLRRHAPPEALPASPAAPSLVPAPASSSAPASGAERCAIVVGAGLAGCATAWALARRGWQVDLIERQLTPARETSAHEAAVLHPLLAADDNLAARATRAGLLLATRQWQALRAHGFHWHAVGARETAPGPKEVAALEAMLAKLAFDPAFARWDAARQSAVYPLAGWCHPPSLCAAMLDAAGGAVRGHYGASAAALRRVGDGQDGPSSSERAKHGKEPMDANLAPGQAGLGGLRGAWQALDAQGRGLAQAPVLVLANALEACALLAASGIANDALPLRGVRGQVSMLRKTAPRLDTVLCGDGYALQTDNGDLLFGASYGEDDPDMVVRKTEHAENLVRLKRLLGKNAFAALLGLPSSLQDRLGAFVGQRCVARDRMPLIGRLADEAAALEDREALRGAHLPDLPRHVSLYAALAFGSHGLSWAGLAGELIAAELEGEPAALETDLLAAVDPGRFLLRSLRGK
ncbi:MAG: FAD-dependent 5-carboxymethylaminomethyl-2-thiouridine(34) oxidoreductase MnmC [Candidatus Protistobacter heckmanni]|nr:FAD-dependent 5-carboxymethylaminomethyl-2-thiouridine(34) oxidoreductase MnmC [Candidatus Protistobacter heckmanni]MCS6763710.1 FAD-dependent 5-carboxymethylaminomethyl-2-thiouridine(34) oxidoreductase MnmC [Candidatus Protistobacter heckmanni]